ncbi:MAG: carbamoyltransferase HypF [Candidatus Omnitrophica bacterium]|nr:carbamoyltransferase HypF [Candidatus Omnitrophota bacterium]
MESRKLKLPFRLKKPVLALGSQAKNTICFAKGNTAWISPVHADLGTWRDLLVFENDLERFLQMRPEIIACDLHPEYQSSKYTLRLANKYRLEYIQHHHAHIAACMADNDLGEAKVIGVAFDGTGLGADNHIWGAEFLICDYKKFSRLAHLKEIPLVGGEKAITEPWRLLAAWLDFDKSVDKEQRLKKIYQAGINSPLASSMGRLFDASASLILGKREARFEAELAVALEKLAAKNQLPAAGYAFNLVKSKGGYILDPQRCFKQIMRDLKSGKPRESIAWRFHRSVAEMTVKTCLALRKKSTINQVALSGGVFQNRLLLQISLDLLCKEGFLVFTHQQLPCNDAGISLGQAMIAGQRS